MYLEDLCFNAQQAAEKAIKGVLLARNIAFPNVHDLRRLRSLLGPTTADVPFSAEDMGWLTPFAAGMRYPDADEPATAEDHERAVALAETVVAWEEERIRDEWVDSGA